MLGELFNLDDRLRHRERREVRDCTSLIVEDAIASIVHKSHYRGIGASLFGLFVNCLDHAWHCLAKRIIDVFIRLVLKLKDSLWVKDCQVLQTS